MVQPSREETNQGLKMAQDLIDLVNNLNANDLWINRRGWRVGQVGLQLRLVFNHGHTKQVREQILKILDLYLSIVPQENLLWWWYSSGKKRDPIPVQGNKAQKAIAEFRTWVDFPNNPFYTCIYSNDTMIVSDESTLHAPKYLFRLAGKNCDHLNLDRVVSSLEIAIPLDWGKTRPKNQGFSWFCKEAVRLLQPRWATAGWGLVLPPKPYLNFEDTQRILYEVLTRFPGIEGVDKVINEKMVGHLYTVNWLNFIHDELLTSLGGREKVKQACAVTSELTETGDIDACLCIQAGPFPPLGDSTQNDFIPAYQAVAKILRPLRTPAMENLCYMPEDADDDEFVVANDAYLRRFDEGYTPPEF
jgi:Protein of unknown function (DUF3396)